MERNTIVGVVFLLLGAVVAPTGVIVQRVPVASFGLAIATIGALVLLIIPEPIPRDAYRSLLEDAVRNVEMILKESDLRERAYFLPTGDGQIRAFVPISQPAVENGAKGLPSYPVARARALVSLEKAILRYVYTVPSSLAVHFADYEDMKGLMLTPPGAGLVELAKVEKGTNLEEALRSVLVEFSGLASSVLAVEEGSKVVKVQMVKPVLTWESPYFNHCFGSSVSCIAGCVTAIASGKPVKIADEKAEPGHVWLSLEIVQPPQDPSSSG